MRRLERYFHQAANTDQLTRIRRDAFHECRLNTDTEIAVDYAISQSKLPIRWNPAAKDYRHIFALHRPAHPVEISMAFFHDAYLCFGTALFWNETSDQVPSNYYVATERAIKSSSIDNVDIDNYYLRDQFMKPHRETKKIAKYENKRFNNYLIKF